MGYTESLTKYTGNFIDELAASGLEHVVISPGSRSTPLAILFADHPQIKQWVIIDERSAAFFLPLVWQRKQDGRLHLFVRRERQPQIIILPSLKLITVGFLSLY